GAAPPLPTPLFFFSSRRRPTSFPRDWRSDVCSPDLYTALRAIVPEKEGTACFTASFALWSCTTVCACRCGWPGWSCCWCMMMDRSEERRVGRSGGLGGGCGGGGGKAERRAGGMVGGG